MGMTAAILEARRKVLGASETPTILGYGKYAGQTPNSVYWSKVGPAVERNDEYLKAGNDFEPALVAFAERKLGLAFETDPSECFQVMLEGIGANILSATPDGIRMCGSQRYGLEGKAVMPGNPAIDQWGDDGTDKVPDNVIIQCQQQMAVWNLEVTFVPVLWCLGYRPEFRLYRVERDEAMWNGWEEKGKWCDGLCTRAVRWWNAHIVPQIPPSDEPAPLDVIKRMERKQGLFIPADTDTFAWIDHWCDTRQDRLNAEHLEEEQLRFLLSKLGDAEGFDLPDGRKFVYREQNGARRCDLDALQRLCEALDTYTFASDDGALNCDMTALLKGFEGAQNATDIYDQIVKQGKHRTPRIVGKGK